MSQLPFTHTERCFPPPPQERIEQRGRGGGSCYEDEWAPPAAAEKRKYVVVFVLHIRRAVVCSRSCVVVAAQFGSLPRQHWCSALLFRTFRNYPSTHPPSPRSLHGIKWHSRRARCARTVWIAAWVLDLFPIRREAASFFRTFRYAAAHSKDKLVLSIFLPVWQ